MVPVARYSARETASYLQEQREMAVRGAVPFAAIVPLVSS